MTLKNEVLDSLLERYQTKAGMHTTVLGEDLVKEAMIPKKAKEGNCMYVI